MSTGGHGADWDGEPGMWQQFRRRRVIGTVILYLICAFLVTEAALFVAPYLELPSWGLRAVFGAAVLGFPLAVVLAWTYDVTPRGIVRTPDELGPEPPRPGKPRLRWILLGAVALVAGMVLRLLRV
jgi:hypothetical protein